MGSNKNIVQAHISFFTYNPKLCYQTPRVEQTGACVTTLGELKLSKQFKKRFLEPEKYKHYKWYNCMLQSELSCGEEDQKLELIHWEIESGNAEIFKLNSEFYVDATIIVGPEMEHWYYSNTSLSCCIRYGSRLRQGNHYLVSSGNILERMKKQLRPEPHQGLMKLAGRAATTRWDMDFVDDKVKIKLEQFNSKGYAKIEDKNKVLEEIRNRSKRNKSSKQEQGRALDTIVEEETIC